MPTSRSASGLQPERDALLVERCHAGDARAWEELVRRHERLVYAVASSYRLSESDLQDVFQDVFAALVRGMARMREPRTLVRWLASTTDRIARATALRRRREQALVRTVPELPEPSPRVAEPQPPVGADLERLEEQALVRIALSRLSPRCRVLLEALYYEEPTPSYRELSRRYGIPVGSLGPTRGRCFERLRRLVEAWAEPSASITRQAQSTSFDERLRTAGERRDPRRRRARGLARRR